MKTFKVGDRVAYSVKFLKSTFQITGALPKARGTVTKVEPLGQVQLVTIDWGDPSIPQRVIAPNLTLVSKIGIDSALNT